MFGKDKKIIQGKPIDNVQNMNITVEHKLTLPDCDNSEQDECQTYDSEVIVWDEEESELVEQDINYFWSYLADRCNLVILTGDPESGKTASCHFFMECLRLGFGVNRNKKQYFFRPPQDFIYKINEINKKFKTNFGVLYSVAELIQAQDATIYIDEPQITLMGGDEKAFINVVTIARHKNQTLIVSSAQSRFFTASIEALCQVFIVKMCNPLLLKRGSVGQRVVKRYCQQMFGTSRPDDIEELFMLDIDQYLYYSHKPKWRMYNGMHENPLCSYWDNEVSTPYRNRPKKVKRVTHSKRDVPKKYPKYYQK